MAEPPEQAPQTRVDDGKEADPTTLEEEAEEVVIAESSLDAEAPPKVPKGEEQEEASDSKDKGKKEKKPACCTRRAIYISIAVIAVLAIAIPIIIIQLIPTLTKNQALDSLDITEETRSILQQLGTYVVVAVAGIGPVIADKEGIFTQEDVRTEDVDLGWVPSPNTEYGWSQSGTLEVEETAIGDSFSYRIITEDDTFGEDTVAEFAAFLEDEKYNPMKDRIKYLLDDEDVLDDFLTDLKMLPKGIENGYLLPTAPHEWEEQSSDEAISRIFWYGIGSVLIMGPEFRELYKDGGDEVTGFQIDMDISDLEVRKGFRPYGFRIQFDIDQNVVSIYDPAQDRLFMPGDGQDWEEAKFLVKSTVIVVITAREHLLWSHLMSSNAVARAMTVHLPPNHPIRRMLTVFTFNTNNINSDAKAVLTSERGWIHRMTSFTYESLVALFGAGYVVCDIFQPFKDKTIGPGLQRVIDDGRFPYYNEGMAHYQVVHDFVTAWFSNSGEGVGDVYALPFYEDIVDTSKGMAYEIPPYSPENMIDIISQFIWVVTAYHELVGGIVEYTQLPDFSGFRTVTDMVTTDTESYVLGLYLTGRTGLRMPKLIADYTNFFGKGDGIPAWEVEVWAGFQDALRVQSDVVRAADAARIENGQPEFKIMDPALFESAISI